MSTLVAAGSAIAAKKAIERLTEDVYDLVKKDLGKQFRRWRTKAGVDTLYTKIKNIRNVKTILQPEKAVDLFKFYYPIKVKFRKELKAVHELSGLGVEKRIVIQGTVGQGKSIFLRYLTSREMIKGNAIPLFVELRRVRKNETLIEHLVSETQAIGLKDIDSDTLEWLADKNKLILFLDAFDEVPEDKRQELITDIERIAKAHDSLQIIISSRPNSGIESSALFRVVEMARLEESEYEEVIKKMADESVAENIIKAVKTSRSSVRGLLTTPLMIALLIVRHRIEQTIPENVLGFYQGLFGLLIARHDKMKGGYTRPRKSRLGDTSLEEVFEATCFLSAKLNKTNFDHRELATLIKDALKITGYICEADVVLEDICKITCLILEEGGQYRFIHKSVQEYSAASFVKNQPDKVASEFYLNLRNATSPVRLDWEQVLTFLAMTDKYRLFKWCIIPLGCSMLGVSEQDIQNELTITDELILRIFRGLGARPGKTNSISWFLPLATPFGTWYMVFKLLDVGIFDGLQEIDLAYEDLALDSTVYPERGHHVQFTGKLRTWAEQKIKTSQGSIKHAQEYVKQIEAREQIFKI